MNSSFGYAVLGNLPLIGPTTCSLQDVNEQLAVGLLDAHQPHY